jgi:acyl-CoA reductase-like NAD-dependent aldehyde dehydrogenase
MLALRAWLIRNRADVIDTLVRESGKTYEDALLAEIGYLLNAIGFWAGNARRYLRDERIRTRSPFLLGRKVVVRYEPVGVVGVIASWNFPLNLGIGDAIPALMAGNAVVIKPSSVTPLSTWEVVEVGMRAAGFPEAICQVATGRASTGEVLIDAVDMVMFTGSTEVGRRIMARAGERLIPATAELGGKDPMMSRRCARARRHEAADRSSAR